MTRCESRGPRILPTRAILGALVCSLALCAGGPYRLGEPRVIAAYDGVWIHDLESVENLLERLPLYQQHHFNTVYVKAFFSDRGDPETDRRIGRIATRVHDLGMALYIYLYQEMGQHPRPADSVHRAFVNSVGREVKQRHCLYNQEVWTDALFPNLFYLAGLSRTLPIAGAKIDVEHISNDSPCYCDACWARYAKSEGHPSSVAGLKPAERFRWLDKHGRLRDYENHQEARLDSIVKAIRNGIDAVNPNLRLGMDPVRFNIFFRPFLRHLSTPRAPAVFDSWITYHGGFREAVLLEQQKVKSFNSNNLYVPWAMAQSYLSEDLGACLYFSAVNTDGACVAYIYQGMIAAKEKVPVDYHLPKGVTKEDHWQYIRRANTQIAEWVASGGTSETTFELRPPKPVSHADFVAPMALPDLVPVSDKPVGDIGQDNTLWRPYAQGMRFYVFLPTDDRIRIRVTHGGAGKRPRSQPINYLLSGNDGMVIRRGQVAPEGQEMTQSELMPPGVYCLTIGTGGVWMQVNIENPYAVAAGVSPTDPVHCIWLVEPLYFHVPPGTKSFEILVRGRGPGEHVRARVYAPKGNGVPIEKGGRLVLDEEGEMDTFMRFAVDVPPDADGAVWKVVLTKPDWGYMEDVAVRLVGIPSYFATSPSRLLAPRGDR